MKLIPIPEPMKARCNHPSHDKAVQCDCGYVFVPERTDVVWCPKCQTTELLSDPKGLSDAR